MAANVNCRCVRSSGKSKVKGGLIFYVSFLPTVVIILIFLRLEQKFWSTACSPLMVSDFLFRLCKPLIVNNNQLGNGSFCKFAKLHLKLFLQQLQTWSVGIVIIKSNELEHILIKLIHFTMLCSRSMVAEERLSEDPRTPRMSCRDARDWPCSDPRVRPLSWPPADPWTWALRPASQDLPQPMISQPMEWVR